MKVSVLAIMHQLCNACILIGWLGIWQAAICTDTLRSASLYDSPAADVLQTSRAHVINICCLEQLLGVKIAKSDGAESGIVWQVEAAQQRVQVESPTPGSGNDDSDADTVKSGGTEPHTSSEDEGEEVLGGTLDQPGLGDSGAALRLPSSSQPAAAPQDTGDDTTPVCNPCFGVMCSC